MNNTLWRVFNPNGGVVAISLEFAAAVQQAHHLSTLRAKLTTNPGRYKVRSH